MKRIFRFALISAAVLVFLAAAALIALRIIFPPEKLKALALVKLQEALKREVRIDSVSIGLRGLNLDHLEVSESPDFKSGGFLSVGALQASLRLRPLLERKIEISKIILEDWSCVIVKQPNGSLNASSIGGLPQRTSPANSHVAPPPGGGRVGVGVTSVKEGPLTPALSHKERGGTGIPEWAVGHILSRNGKITYKDPKAGLVLTVNDINLEMNGVQEQGPFPIQLSFKYSGNSGKTPLQGSVDYRGTTDLSGMNASKMEVIFDSLKLDHNGIKLEASGQVDNLENPEISAKIKVPSLTPENLQAVSGASSGVSLPSLTGEIRIKKTLEGIALNQIHLVLGGLALDAQGRVLLSDVKQPSIDVDVKTNEFSISDVAGLYPPAKDYHLQGTAAITVRASGSTQSPALTGDATLKSLSAVYSGMNFQGVAGSGHFSPASISADLSGKWNKNDFKFNLNAADYQKAPNIHIEGTLAQLDLSTLPADQPSSNPAPKNPPTAESGKTASTPSNSGASSQSGPTLPLKTSGKISVGKIIHPNFTASKADLDWDLTHASEMSRISGSAKLKISDGKFDNLKALGESNSMVHIALLPIILLQKIGSLAKVPLLPAFDRVAYKEITGNYAFQNGLMTVKESHIDSSLAYVTTSGTADLGKDQLKLHISTKLGGLGTPIGFNVEGPLSSPSVKVDVAAILKQQPIVNDAVEQGKKLLQNLFK